MAKRRKRIRVEKLGSLLVLFLFCGTAMAEATGVTATVDRNLMAVGDTFTYSVSVDSQSSVRVDTPKWPELRGFTMVNTWSGNEVQSVFTGGTFTTKRKQTFNLQLQAQQEGVFEIGAAELEVDGQVYRTKPITIRVE